MEIHIPNPNNPLGSGGYSFVFAGTYKGKDVAVKRILLLNAGDDNEVKVMQQLDHPNIVKLLHVENNDDFRFIALELCVASLDQIFLEPENPRKYKGPELPNHLEIFLQLAEGLEYIHSKNLFHRDIKPANVLISTDDQQKVTMKLADFGLSKSVNERGTCSMNSGVKGTNNWLAPELLKSIANEEPQQGRGTVKSDVFALGLVFGYLLLKGEHLYGKRHEINENILDNKPVNMKRISKSLINNSAVDVIKQMLTGDPKERISSSGVKRQLNEIKEVTFEPANNGSRYEEDDKKETRLAISMKDPCKETKNIVDGMTVYTLPLETTILNASFKFRRFSFGRITDHKIKKKTILLVGATGSGKTTWINAMINYVLGVEWDDPFRFLLVDEKVRRPSRAHSQTQSVTAVTLLSDLSDVPTKSLQMTQEVLKTRRCLEIQLDHGLKDIKSELFKAEHLRKIEEIIAQNKDKFDTNDDKEIMIPRLEKVKVAVDEKSALNCTKCKVTCQYPCKPIPLAKPFCPAFFGSQNIMNLLNETLQLENGSTSRKSLVSIIFDAMPSLFSVTCLVCPGQCSIRDHENKTTRWDLIEINALRTLRDIGKDYKDAEGNPLSVQGIRDKLKYDIDQQEKNILEAMSEITKCSNTLKEIALRKDPSWDPLLTMPEYIDMMIKNEKKYPTPEYEKRIDSLENILKKAKLYAGAETKTTFEWESSTNPNDFHLCID